MAITVLPDPPSRASPSDFSARADTFLGALPTFCTEANTLAADVNTKQSQAATSATNAATSASQAATSATNAATSATNASNSATAAANSANSALNAPGTNATSTSSLTIATGNQTFTIQTGKAFSVGQRVVIARTTTPTTSMTGIITAHNSGTGSMTVAVDATSGSGTQSAWTVSLSATGGVTSVNGSVGVITNLATTNSTENISNKTFISCKFVENVLVIGTATTAIQGNTYVLTASLTLTLPSSPSAGHSVQIYNASGVSTCVIARNGSNIMSTAEDMTVDKLNAGFTLVYADTSRGWVIL